MRTEAAPELLEREAELAALGEAVEAAADGAGRVVWLEGEAGIGKSRLVAATAALARAREMTVLEARGGELEREFPFGVIRQLFEARLAEAGEEERAELLSGPAGLAAPLVDVAPGPADGRRVVPGAPRALLADREPRAALPARPARRRRPVGRPAVGARARVHRPAGAAACRCCS